MATPKRTLQHIRTVSELLDRRKARTSAGALMELSALDNERLRMQHELDRMRRRQAEIKARLSEIAEKEKRLYAFVKKPRRSARMLKGSDDALSGLRLTEVSY